MRMADPAIVHSLPFYGFMAVRSTPYRSANIRCEAAASTDRIWITHP